MSQGLNLGGWRCHSLFKAFFFFSTPPATTLLTRFPEVFPLAVGVLAPGARPILPAWLEGWSTVDAAGLGEIMVLGKVEAFTEGWKGVIGIDGDGEVALVKFAIIEGVLEGGGV